MTVVPTDPDTVAATVTGGREQIAAASSVEELRSVEAGLLGKRSALARANQQLGTLPPEKRREAGRALNEARSQLAEAVAARRAELEEAERSERLAAERLDLTEVTGGLPRGHLHLVTQTRDELEDLFVGMGYTVAEGPEVETDRHNFEALNMPPGHPARSMWDTLYVRLGEPESTVLRTHTSLADPGHGVPGATHLRGRAGPLLPRRPPTLTTPSRGFGVFKELGPGLGPPRARKRLFSIEWGR